MQPEIFQRAGEAASAGLQLAVVERTIGIDKGQLVATAARDLSVDQVRHGVVRPANQEVFQHRTVPPCGRIYHATGRWRACGFHISIKAINKGVTNESVSVEVRASCSPR